MTERKLMIIGRAERIQFPQHGESLVPAKVDTGADSSSVWASNVSVEGTDLTFTLFDPTSPHFTGTVIRIPSGQYREVVIESSFGHRELRYAAKLPVRVKGRRIRATFTLADRSAKTYPVLLGRRFLTGKFLVDVSQGEPLAEDQKTQSAKRQRTLKSLKSKA